MSRRRDLTGQRVVPSAKANHDVRVFLEHGGVVRSDRGVLVIVEVASGTQVICERAHVKRQPEKLP